MNKAKKTTAELQHKTSKHNPTQNFKAQLQLKTLKQEEQPQSSVVDTTVHTCRLIAACKQRNLKSAHRNKRYTLPRLLARVNTLGGLRQQVCQDTSLEEGFELSRHVPRGLSESRLSIG